MTPAFEAATPAYLAAALAWGLAVALSMAGWGATAVRLAGGRRPDLGLQAALGLAGFRAVDYSLGQRVDLVLAQVGEELEVADHVFIVGVQPELLEAGGRGSLR